jgi:hypothetical protein
MMRRIRRPVIGVLAAATVAAAGLAATPPASAMSMECTVRWTIWAVYRATGDAAWVAGNTNEARRWYAVAEGVVALC